jgi:hypothetical protein
MYINPFLAGVIFIVMSIILLLFIYGITAVIKAEKEKKK